MNIITQGNSSPGNHHVWPAVKKKICQPQI